MTANYNQLLALPYTNRKADNNAKIQEKKIREEEKKIERIFYTYREAQEFLNVSHETLRQLMKQGLPSHKVGRKRVFLIRDLIRWIEEH